LESKELVFVVYKFSLFFSLPIGTEDLRGTRPFSPKQQAFPCRYNQTVRPVQFRL